MKNPTHLAKQVIVNKNVRSTAVLIVTMVLVLLINSLLPVIEGNTHYTEDAITITYKEYKQRKQENNNYQLSWVTEKDIALYKLKYIAAHPEIILDDTYLIEPPDHFKVEVYTKFFFQYPFWYLSTTLHVVSTILVFYSVFNYLLTRAKAHNTKYIELDTQVTTLVDTKLDPVTFEPWMDEQFNYQRKLLQHRANINYKLNKLERKTNALVRIKAKTDPTDPKCANYLCAKEDLYYYLQDEYIDTYLKDIDVKGFQYIHPTFVSSGYNAVGRSVDTYSLIKSNSRRIGEDSVRKIITTTMLTVLIAVLLTLAVISSLDKPWYWMIVNILTTLLPLAMQIPMAYDYCDKYMEEQLITTLIQRRSIAFLYLAYMDEQSKEVDHNAMQNPDNNRLGDIDAISERTNTQTDS